jgi:hypothetical protein
MRNRIERNYRTADCCDVCKKGIEEYLAKVDIYRIVCNVDGKPTGSFLVCDDFEREAN